MGVNVFQGVLWWTHVGTLEASLGVAKELLCVKRSEKFSDNELCTAFFNPAFFKCLTIESFLPEWRHLGKGWPTDLEVPFQFSRSPFLVLALPLTCCMTLAKSPFLLVPQFIKTWNGCMKFRHSDLLLVPSSKTPGGSPELGWHFHLIVFFLSQITLLFN